MGAETGAGPSELDPAGATIPDGVIFDAPPPLFEPTEPIPWPNADVSC